MGDSAKFFYPGQEGWIFDFLKIMKFNIITRSLFNFLIPERLSLLLEYGGHNNICKRAKYVTSWVR